MGAKREARKQIEQEKRQEKTQKQLDRMRNRDRLVEERKEARQAARRQEARQRQDRATAGMSDTQRAEYRKAELEKAARRDNLWFAGPAVVVVVLGTLVYFGFGDDDPREERRLPPTVDTSDDDYDYVMCPYDLKVLGPFYMGVDDLYDPGMDWDGDGVSCEP